MLNKYLLKGERKAKQKEDTEISRGLGHLGMAQSVKCLTLAQVMILRCGFEPHVGLCAEYMESGGCFGFCVSLSLCPSLLTLSLSLSKINKH